MKKKIFNILILSLMFFGFLGFNVNSANAFAPGCTSASQAFSTTTGQPCGTNTSVVTCPAGDVYSSESGKLCTAWQNDSGDVANFNILFKSSFVIGSRGADVKALQQFLKEQGYFFGKVDGKYGRITARAVKDFQEDNDISVTPTIPVITPVSPIACTMEARVCSDGSYVSRTGPRCEFTACPAPTNNNSPVISGVSGPQTLRVNEQGTWTITISSATRGTLSYSVVWGDENLYPYSASPVGLDGGMNNQIATFTHSYQQAGNYSPKFTVKNENAILASASINVIVSASTTPIYPLSNAKVGNLYTEVLEVSSDIITNRSSYTIVAGSLPEGLNLTATNYGEFITGTPKLAGTYSFTLRVGTPSANGGSYSYTNGQFTIIVDAASSTTLIKPVSVLFVSPSFMEISSDVSKTISIGKNGANNLTKATYNFLSNGSGSSSTITELKFSISAPNTVTSVSIDGNSAAVVNGVAWINGLNIFVPNGGSANRDVYISYPEVGVNGIPSGSTSHISLEYIKYTSGGITSTECTAAFGACTQSLISVPSPVMTLTSS